MNSQSFFDANSEDSSLRSRCHSYESNVTQSISNIISPISSRPESTNSHILTANSDHPKIPATISNTIDNFYRICPSYQDNSNLNSNLAERFSNLNLNTFSVNSDVLLLNSRLESYLPVEMVNFVNFVFNNENTKYLAQHLLMSILSELEQKNL